MNSLSKVAKKVLANPYSKSRGFTLIELMVTVAIVAILSSVALPSYSTYVKRSRVMPALDALTSGRLKLEQMYQDTGTYAQNGGCGTVFSSTQHFSVSCVVSSQGQAFTLTATGQGQMSGYSYSIDESGMRMTVSHPQGIPGQACWSIRGSSCDA